MDNYTMLFCLFEYNIFVFFIGYYSSPLGDMVFEWQRGWRWPCFDTDLSSFVMQAQQVIHLDLLHKSYKSYRAQKSPIRSYFYRNSPYNRSANLCVESVVDSSHYTWSNCKYAIVLRVCWNPILSSGRMPHTVMTVGYHSWRLTVANGKKSVCRAESFPESLPIGWRPFKRIGYQQTNVIACLQSIR